MNREAFFSKSHLIDCCRALTDGSSIMQNTLIITRRHVFRITMFNSGFSDLQIRRHTHSEQDENKKATFYMLQWRKENLSVPSKETVFNIHKAFLLHSFPSCTLLIDTISATEMTQISNTNTVFLVRSFQTGDMSINAFLRTLLSGSRQARICCHANQQQDQSLSNMPLLQWIW